MGQLLKTNKRHVRNAIARWGLAYEPYSQAGENNPAWKGGVVVDSDGYVLVHMPEHPHCTIHGKVRKHRVVMEELLGRLLLPGEVVHHKDKNKLNNSPDNLVLYRNNGRHLAEELAGKCPKWTDEGKRRIAAGVRQARRNERLARQAASRSSSATHSAPRTDDPAVL